MSVTQLPWDVCRCRGIGCGAREQCLRHEQLNNLGPRTPVTDHLCTDGRLYYHPITENKSPSDDTYDEWGVNTKNSFNTPPNR